LRPEDERTRKEIGNGEQRPIGSGASGSYPLNHYCESSCPSIIEKSLQLSELKASLRHRFGVLPTSVAAQTGKGENVNSGPKWPAKIDDKATRKAAQEFEKV
jgi:hypothetical protein